ncbi:MAG: response regulator [Chloroflexi bacterium]|nr:response regulator [Chloroflexota bacterium]
MNEIYPSVKTILIVEDDEAIGEFLTLSISQETPYRPLVVLDGFEALKVLRDLKPNLLLLDNRLPSMSGIELYDQLHATKELASIPTIITSASNIEHEIGDRNVSILPKPFELDDLLSMITKILG